MAEVANMDKQQIWAAVRAEFPDDDTMQQVHYVRLLHLHQMAGMSPTERLRFYGTTAEASRTRGVL
jgi:hypothetical protein